MSITIPVQGSFRWPWAIVPENSDAKESESEKPDDIAIRDAHIEALEREVKTLRHLLKRWNNREQARHPEHQDKELQAESLDIINRSRK